MKMRILPVFLMIGTLSPAGAADLTGTVTLKGAPQAELTIDMARDPRCGELHSEAVTTRHYVVGNNGGLANVLVYVKSGLEGKTFPTPAAPAVLDQVGCEYQPYVMGVMVNQKLNIRNSDPTFHNVHATDIAASTDYFNFAQITKGQVNERTFTRHEVPVRFKCDVHAWMFAYVGVMENPYFAVTDEQGNFKITGLPDGKYTMVAYHVKTHREKPGVSREVTVSGDTKADFAIELN